MHQCGESVALLHKPLDGLRKDGEHALVGLEGVVEIDDGTGAHLAFDLSICSGVTEAL